MGSKANIINGFIQAEFLLACRAAKIICPGNQHESAACDGRLYRAGKDSCPRGKGTTYDKTRHREERSDVAIPSTIIRRLPGWPAAWLLKYCQPPGG